MRLGDILSELREDRGLTQLELSKRLHISNSSISAYETGARIPNVETLKEFAAFFDVTTDYLLGLTAVSVSPTMLTEEFSGGVEMSAVLRVLTSLSHEQKAALLLILESMRFYTEVATKTSQGGADKK